ncbi:MAG: TrmB family transcriptional regulator, partial [Candidatus Nanoarchaeia archaeon]
MKEELQTLGLNNYESKALELLLKEKLNLRELSKKANVPFGKIYSVIKSLKIKGLVKETNTRPKLIYVDNASEVISKLINEKHEKERELTETLRDLASEIDNQRGKTTKFFQIGTTQEDNKNIQLRSFYEAKEEVLQILNIYHKPLSNRPRKTVWENVIVEVVNKGVVFKSIYPSKIILPKILLQLNKKNPEMFQIKRFDTDFPRCDIIDKKKVLIKLVNQDPLQFGGVLFVEDENLAENLTKIFYEMWDQS